MRQVDGMELCTYLANVHKEVFNKYYSNDFCDWLDTIEQYESNANLISEDNNVCIYEVDEIGFNKKGECYRISFLIKNITINDTVNTSFYLSNYDYERYVKDYV